MAHTNPFLDAPYAEMERSFAARTGMDPYQAYLADQARRGGGKGGGRNPVEGTPNYGRPGGPQHPGRGHGGGAGGYGRRPRGPQADPLPITPSPDDDLHNRDHMAAWREHLGGLGFDPAGDGPMDDWLRDLYEESETAWRQHVAQPGKIDDPYTKFLREGEYGDHTALRRRFFSMDPSKRGGMSERFVGPGRTIAY